MMTILIIAGVIFYALAGTGVYVLVEMTTSTPHWGKLSVMGVIALFFWPVTLFCFAATAIFWGFFSKKNDKSRRQK